MSDVAIRCEGLSKQYRIGERESYKALRDVISDVAAAPFRRARAALRNGNGSSIQNPKSEIRNLFWALDDVSFEVKRGEVIGIIGRNGAGKSTLLKILSRITKPTKGHATIHGRVGSLLEVGTGFHPELTGRENIYLNAAILGMRKAEVEKKFDEIVAFAEVEKFIDTPVKRYSSGMYVRLAFSVAAHMESEILLIDEVLAVGDAEFQKKCMGKMGEVADEGRTVIFVSHNMNAIERLCDSAMLIDAGRIKSYQADVREVTKLYLFGESEQLKLSYWENSNAQFNNPSFTPVKFFIADRFGELAAMPIGNNADFWLQIEAEIESVDPALNVGYAIYSEEGHLLFWSYHTDQPPERWPSLSAGRCLLKSKIPKRLLNEGVYRIELIATLHYRVWLLQPSVNAPCIFLTIQGGLSDSPFWMVKRPGLMAPELEWTGVAEPPHE